MTDGSSPGSFSSIPYRNTDEFPLESTKQRQRIRHLPPQILPVFGPRPSDGSRGLPNSLQELHSYVPKRMEDHKWMLLFTTSPHSPAVMDDLRATCNVFKGRCSAFLVVIEDPFGQLFGFFSTRPLFGLETHHDAGEGFLYRLGFDEMAHEAPTVWTQHEQFYQMTEPDLISLRDKSLHSSLSIDKSLKCGKSSYSKSFESPRFCRAELFKIEYLQIFALIPPWKYQKLLRYWNARQTKSGTSVEQENSKTIFQVNHQRNSNNTVAVAAATIRYENEHLPSKILIWQSSTRRNPAGSTSVVLSMACKYYAVAFLSTFHYALPFSSFE